MLNDAYGRVKQDEISLRQAGRYLVSLYQKQSSPFQGEVARSARWLMGKGNRRWRCFCIDASWFR